MDSAKYYCGGAKLFGTYFIWKINKILNIHVSVQKYFALTRYIVKLN